MRIVSTLVGICASVLTYGAHAASCDGFTDVDNANTTYCSAVTYLKDKGITLGCTGTTYCPNDYVTRLQMALFLQRMGRGNGSNSLGTFTNFIGSGENNTTGVGAFDHNAIVGGLGNMASGGYAFVGGGSGNSAAYLSSVTGGQFNTASGTASAVDGGDSNVASGDKSVVIGGDVNTASGFGSVALGGEENFAAGAYSYALGFRARTAAAATGSFVFADSTQLDVTSGTANEFIVAASGGIRMLSDKSGTVGCSLAGGGGSWACSSSRDVKRDFSAIDPQDVLAKAIALPVMRWRYMNESPEIRHMGTFSQDFRAAFGLGSDDKSITLIDAEGVALAAIQGLNAKLESETQDKDARIAALEATVAKMQARMDALSQ